MFYLWLNTQLSFPVPSGSMGICIHCPSLKEKLLWSMLTTALLYEYSHKYLESSLAMCSIDLSRSVTFPLVPVSHTAMDVSFSLIYSGRYESHPAEQAWIPIRDLLQ